MRSITTRCTHTDHKFRRCFLSEHDPSHIDHVYSSKESVPGKLRTATLERLNYLEAKVEAIRLDLDVVSDTLAGRNETLNSRNHELRNPELQSIIDNLREKVLSLISERDTLLAEADKWKNAAGYGWNREAKAVNLLEKAIKALDPIVDFENEDAPAVETRDLIQSALNTLSVINQPEAEND